MDDFQIIDESFENTYNHNKTVSTQKNKQEDLLVLNEIQNTFIIGVFYGVVIGMGLSSLFVFVLIYVGAV